MSIHAKGVLADGSKFLYNKPHLAPPGWYLHEKHQAQLLVCVDANITSDTGQEVSCNWRVRTRGEPGDRDLDRRSSNSEFASSRVNETGTPGIRRAEPPVESP